MLATSLLALAFLRVPSPQAAPADLKVPDGLEITLWATTPQLFNPAAIDIDARGRVWVAEAVNYRRWEGRNPGLAHPEGDRIVILEDTDLDGRCDRTTVFAQDKDLVSPLGICVLGDGGPGTRVIVSCSPNAFIYIDDDGDGRSDRRETFLTGFGGPDHDHGLHSFVPFPDGYLYFAAGNAGPHLVTDKSGFHLRSGSLYDGGGATTADNKPGLVSDDGRVWVGGLIARVRPDGTGLQILAHNFRNNYEVALDSFGNMFTEDNDDDGNQGCRTTWVMEGGNYGYFSADGSRYWNADRRPGQDAWRAHWHQDDPGVVPAGTRNGAGGPTGVCVYEGDLMAKWIDGAVLNCDAGRGVVFAHRPKTVGAGIELEPGMLVELREGARNQDLTWNEQFDEGKRNPHASWFRPSDVAVAPDGSVFVSDWFDPGVGGHAAGDKECIGSVYRIAPKGVKSTVPKFDLATNEGIVRAFASPNLNARHLGGERIAAETGFDALIRALKDSNPRVRARAWFLEGSPHARYLGDDTYLHKFSIDDPMGNANVSIAMARAFRPELFEFAESEIARVIASPTTALSRELAIAVRDVSFDRCAWWLIALAMRLDPADRYAIEAFGIACEGKEEKAYALLSTAIAKDAEPEKWSDLFATIAWRLHPPSAVADFAARAAAPSISPAARKQATDALAFIATREAAEAMLNLALAGPTDARDHAAYWIRHRDTNNWRAFGLGAQLATGDLARATQRFASGILHSGSRDVDVDVTGASVLWLVVDEGKNGNGFDWAAWVEPRFVGPFGEQRATELPMIRSSAAWGAVHIDKNCDGGPLRVGNRDVRGIGTHARSEIAYRVPEGATRFRAIAACDDGGCGRKGATTELELQVWVEVPPDRAPLRALEKCAADATAPIAEREEAAAKLAIDPEGGQFLLRLAAKNQLDAALRPRVAEAIYNNPDLAVRALATQHFPRTLPGGATLPSLDDLAALRGDARHGQQLFFGNVAQCSRCHVVRGRGNDVGPDLTAIRTKYPPRALIDSILNPSAAITHGFDTWRFTMKDERTITGFVLAEGATVIVKDTQGARQVFAATDIVEREKQSLSVMPQGLELGLGAQGLADVTAFLLEDRSAPPKLGPEVALFNGRDFTGWTFHLSDPNKKLEDVWSIRDGILTCKGNPAGYLRTTDDFTSFVLTLEWRFNPERGPGNSGVLMRMTGRDKVWPRSIEAQLMHRNAGDIWNIDEVPMVVDPTRTDGRHTAKSQPCNERPLGEWNRYVITLDGGDLTLEVNGVVQNTASWCEEIAGKICLQSEGAEIQFRNVKLRPILR